MRAFLLCSLVVSTTPACGPAAPTTTAPRTGTPATEETAEVSDLEAQVSAMVEPLVESARVHGVVAIVVQGEQSLTRSFGSVATLPNPRLQIGSVTKVYTALLLADAIERGEIAEDATLADLSSEPLPEAIGSISARSLATHRSGLPRLPSMEGSSAAAPYAHFDRAAIVDALAATEVGTETFAYSNFGAAVLGQMLATHLGEPYEALVRARILEPLEMNDSSFDEEDLVVGHPHYGGESPPWDLAAFAPAGGLVSTGADQLRFLRAQLSPPASPVGRAIARSQRPLAPADGGRIAYGWMVSPSGVYWHNGQTGSFHSFVAFEPRSGTAVALLADTAAMEVDDAANRLLGSLLGLDVEPPSWPPPRAVPSELLARYVGDYQLAAGFVLSITREGEQLFIRATGQDRYAIYPVGEAHRFELRVTPASGTFQLPESGPATALVWSQGGGSTRAPRVTAD